MMTWLLFGWLFWVVIVPNCLLICFLCVVFACGCFDYCYYRFVIDDWCLVFIVCGFWVALFILVVACTTLLVTSLLLAVVDCCCWWWLLIAEGYSFVCLLCRLLLAGCWLF